MVMLFSDLQDFCMEKSIFWACINRYLHLFFLGRLPPFEYLPELVIGSQQDEGKHPDIGIERECAHIGDLYGYWGNIHIKGMKRSRYRP